MKGLTYNPIYDLATGRIELRVPAIDSTGRLVLRRRWLPAKICKINENTAEYQRRLKDHRRSVARLKLFDAITYHWFDAEPSAELIGEERNIEKWSARAEPLARFLTHGVFHLETKTCDDLRRLLCVADGRPSDQAAA